MKCSTHLSHCQKSENGLLVSENSFYLSCQKLMQQKGHFIIITMAKQVTHLIKHRAESHSQIGSGVALLVKMYQSLPIQVADIQTPWSKFSNNFPDSPYRAKAIFWSRNSLNSLFNYSSQLQQFGDENGIVFVHVYEERTKISNLIVSQLFLCN